jgi:hypothetical protein
VDGIIAESFDLHCAMKANECDGGAIPDRDYCYAQIVVRECGGKITLTPTFPKTVKGGIY